MFSTPDQLKKRTGDKGTCRLDYLKELVSEFENPKCSQEAKEQVLANLANFAYDPINYPYFRTLRIIDIFLEQINQTKKKLIQYAVSGICNLILDPLNKEYIEHSGGIQLISNCLSTNNDDIIIPAITTLIFLVSPENISVITSDSNIKYIREFSKSENKILQNIALVFLQDLCSDKTNI